jgi:hypothetical protein
MIHEHDSFPNGKIVILYIARDMIQATVSFMEKESPGKLQCKSMALGNVLEATNIVVPSTVMIEYQTLIQDTKQNDFKIRFMEKLISPLSIVLDNRGL